MGDMLRRAKEGKYGIIGVCPGNVDGVEAGFIAARKAKSPVIICFNFGTKRIEDGYFRVKNHEVIGRMVKHYAEKYPDVECALCLDHGDSLEAALRAIRAGFTGVMVDKSMFDVDKNAEVLKEVVKVAHSFNVAVEGAIGGVEWRDPTLEEIESHMTKVPEMVKLSKETGVDIVAVFVGSSHGDNKKKDGAVIHFDLVEDLRDCSPTMLCMHGSSSTGKDKLKRLAQSGMCKFNVGSDIALGAVEDGFYKYYNDGKYSDEKPRDFINCFKSFTDGFTDSIGEFMDVFGSAGKSL